MSDGPRDFDALADAIAEYAKVPEGDPRRTADFVLSNPGFAPDVPADLLVRYRLAKVDEAVRELLPFRPTTQEVLARLREESPDLADIVEQNVWMVEEKRAQMAEEREREYLRRLDEA